MRFGRVLSTAWRTLLGRPSDLLPLYLLSTAVQGLVQVGMLLGIGTVALYLSVTGGLAEIRRNLSGLDQPPDPESTPGAFEVWVDEVLAALEPLATPAVVVIVGFVVTLTIVVVALVSAAVGAAQFSACLGRLRDRRGLVDGVAGARRYWLSFVGLSLLELAAWTGITVVALLLSVAGPAGVFVGLVGWLVGALLIATVFAFAPVAVVVDETTAVRGVRYAASFLRHRPVEAGLYIVTAFVAYVGFGVIVSTLGVVGVAAGPGLVGALAVTPFLHLLKVALYAGGRGVIGPVETFPNRPFRSRVRDGTRRSVRELAGFVRERPGTHVVAASTLVGGLLLGWYLASPLEGVFESSIAGRLVGHTAPVAAATFFGNNWTVALTMGFSGLFAVVPALTQLAYNGIVIGALARTEVAPLELLAFVAPHGVFEIPAIVVAGAVGIFLGTTWVRTWRGAGSRVDLADALERAFWVLLGVGLLLAIAALIEGFVSPYYWRPFL
ncbi:stage II sporulation protein M [Halovivax cerinus]|uniref:Stage II sporulation protein M n=1 Tax=Halovivax cerinus TaxID=1487865 RepID=A0ABD5NLH9_9EURY|nr:stage II sporulation protein M [Halovivax cerinus]